MKEFVLKGRLTLERVTFHTGWVVTEYRDRLRI